MEINVLASSSKGNCTVINDGQTTLLIDCGIRFKEIQKQLKFTTSHLSSVLVTHPHADHSRSVSDLMKAGIDIHLLESAASEIGISGHRIKTIQPMKQFSVGSLTILPFPLLHDVENVGYLVASKDGKLVYITDTQYCPYRFKDLTVVMVEANFSLDILNANVANGTVPLDMKKRLLRTHMSLETAKEFLRANDLSRVEAIWLLHLSDQNSCSERFKKEVQGITGKPTYIA
jgi:phosphoribosyl 1,2-cyclic phosphodiesterase